MNEPIEKDCEGEFCNKTISWFWPGGREKTKEEYDKSRFHNQSCAATYCGGNRPENRSGGKVFFLEQTPINKFIYGKL